MSRYCIRFAYEQNARPYRWGRRYINMDLPFGVGTDTRGTLGLELPLLAEGRASASARSKALVFQPLHAVADRDLGNAHHFVRIYDVGMFKQSPVLLVSLNKGYVFGVNKYKPGRAGITMEFERFYLYYSTFTPVCKLFGGRAVLL
jgi:hypothetical protein